MNKIFMNQAGFGRTGIIIAVVVVITVVAICFILQAERKETIKIGAIISLTGPASHLEVVRDGMLLAVDEINSWSGINGRKIELIIEDSKTNSQEGKKAFNKIETEHHPVLYVATNSSVFMALAPLAEKNRVVLVGLVVATPKLTKQNEWVFKYYTTPEGEVRPILSILEELKVKELCIFYQDDAFGASYFGLLKEEFQKTGGVVRSEAFEVKNPDFKGKIVKLKDAKAIYIVGFVKHARQAIRQLREESFDGFILGNSGLTNLIKTTPEANGAYVAAPALYNPNYLFAKEVKGKYEARYSKPFIHQAANGYDFIKLLAGLLEDKEVSRESVKNLLERGFMYHGVFGELDVKPGEHDITFPLHPAQIVDGKLKYLR